jgi:hypothetical protein
MGADDADDGRRSVPRRHLRSEITVAAAAKTLEGDWLSTGLPDDD